MLNYILGFVAIITLPIAKGTVQACIDTLQAGRNVRAFYTGFKKEWNRTEERPVPTDEQRKAAKLALFQAYYRPQKLVHDELVISVPAISDAQTACMRNNYQDMTSRQLRATLERWRDVNGYKPPKSISRMTKAEMLEEVLTEYELDALNEV